MGWGQVSSSWKVLSSKLARNDASEGSALVAHYDPIAPAFLKTTSDMINGMPVSVLRFIAKSKWAAIRNWTSADDVTTEIQNGIDQMQADYGKGKVFFPWGWFNVSRLKLYSFFELDGEGKSSLIYQLSATTGALIYNNANTDQLITIKNLYLHGNKAAQTATNAIISLDGGGTPSTTGDHMHTLENLFLLNSKGHALALTNGVREVKLMNVHVHGADRRGFSMGCTDSHFSNFSAGSCGEEGIYVGGANNRLVCGKAFAAGRLVTTSPGIKVDSAGDRCQLSAMEAQDNSGHGFDFDGCEAPIASGLVADSNGVGASNTAGIRINNVVGGAIGIVARNRAGKTTQTHGAAIGGTTSGVHVCGDLTGNATADYTYTASGVNKIDTVKNIDYTDDTTPSVLNARSIMLTPTAPQTVTNLIDGFEGQTVEIYFGNNSTTFDFTANPNMVGNSGVDYTPTTGHMIIARRRGAKWFCECVKGS